jgi:hypothetical protein
MNAIQVGYDKAKSYIDKAYDASGKFLDKNPVLYKIVLVACHFFRTAAMYGLMMWLPIPKPATAAGMIAGTLLYRAAVERFCIFRFAIPSMVGAGAAWLAHVAIVNFVSGAALTSVGMTVANSLALVPLAGYIGWVSYISHRDIEQRMKTLSGNKKKIGEEDCCCTSL